MIDPVKDRFGEEIHIGSLVAIATNSGMYVGRVNRFNTNTDANGHAYLTTVRVFLMDKKRNQSYDIPHVRMINLDNIHHVAERENI